MRLTGWLAGLAAGCVAAFASTAAAEPFEAEGTAPLGNPPAEQVARQQAIAEARKQALSAALSGIPGPLDPTARREVEAAPEAWTGAYRILEQRITGDALAVRLEVDVDLSRLAKRLLPRTREDQAPTYRLGRVRAERSCGTAIDRVPQELAALGAVGTAAVGPIIELDVKCQALGPVRHTFVHAGRVSVTAFLPERTLASHGSIGLAPTDEGAIEAGLMQVLGELASDLSAHRRDAVRLRVRDPLPAADVRRLQRALEERVLGITDVRLVELEPDGSVWFELRGRLEVNDLAAKLQALELPGSTLTVEHMEGPHALVVRLD